MLELLGHAAVLALVRRWWWVVAGAAIAALVGALIAGLRSPSYAASVDVVPTRGQVVAGPVTSGSPNWIVGATPERRQAMTQLVRNPDIELIVQQELGASLPEALREPGRLLSLVRARTALRSEVITIVVEAGEPGLARDVARAWGRAYERHINRLYGPGEVALAQDTVLAGPVPRNRLGWALRGALVGALAAAIAVVVWPVRRTGVPDPAWMGVPPGPPGRTEPARGVPPVRAPGL